MSDIAVIAAASWKGAGYKQDDVPPDAPYACYPLETCPEALLPLPGGHTILSRLVCQLRYFGFRAIFITVGPVGCRFHRVRETHGRFVKEEQAALGDERSPWTWERLEYVRHLAIPIIVPNPDDFNFEESYVRALDTIGWDWDRLLLVHGDTVLTNRLLARALLEEPSVCVRLHPYHNLFWLTPEDAREYRNILASQSTDKAAKLAGYCTAIRERGVALVDVDTQWPEHKRDWRDVDYRGDYRAVAISPAHRSSWMEDYGHL